MYTFNKEKHIHLLDNKPLMGTSTVLGILAKPLTWWASGLAVSMLGWSNPKLVTAEERTSKVTEAKTMIDDLDAESYLALLDKAYRAHAEKLETSAEAGTDLHAELERYVKDVMSENDGQNYNEKIIPFIEWTQKNVKRFLWSELYCYSDKLWLGGISDCGAELNNGELAIIDFKSSKDAYPSQFFQIAGYDLEISENGGFTETGKKIFTPEKPVTQYIIVPFGNKNPYPVVVRDVQGCKNAFLGALAVYKQLNKEQHD